VTKVRPYDEYKESEVEWLGMVPSHWSIQRLGSRFVERRETVSDKDFQPLSVTMQGIVPQLETAAKTDNGDNRKRVNIGDFVINSRSDRKGSAGLSKLRGSVSVISTVIKPRSGVNGPFIHYLLRSQPFQEEYYRFGTGIVADLWSTRYSSMKRITLAMPPELEQAKIADFLDRETAQIDDLIGKQERLIELLAYKRQAVITQAVTKGLDPNAPTKPSGIPWLGSIPTHWAASRLKWTDPTQESGTSVNGMDVPAGPSEIGVLKTGAVSKGQFVSSANKTVVPEDLDRVSCPVRAGTLIVNRANTPDLVGSTGLTTQSMPNLFLSDKLWQIDFQSAEASFVFWWSKTDVYRSQVQFRRVGASATMQNLSYPDFLTVDIALPSIEVQRTIAQFLGQKTDRIDALTIKAEQTIKLLRERRSALISAAVTGKIDVREGVA
jgi:type I restriction enzyme, S subunit